MKRSELFLLGIITILLTTSGFTQDKGLLRQKGERIQKTAALNPPVSTIQRYAGGTDTAWTRHYRSYLLDGEDMAMAVATDDSGNTYVTGYVQNAGTDLDVVTLKYNAVGSLV